MHRSAIPIVDHGRFPPIIMYSTYQYILSLLLFTIFTFISLPLLLILLSKLSSVHKFFPLSLVDILDVSPSSYPFYKLSIFHFIVPFVVDVNYFLTIVNIDIK